VRRRYLGLGRQRRPAKLSSWEASDDGALALVIVLDQFPRNMFRGDARTYASDPWRARRPAAPSSRGADARIDPGCWNFSTCPSCIRSICRPERCIELFRKRTIRENLKYAEHHADIIRRFGRFRTAIASWARDHADEQAFLDEGGFSG
jgi:uncharacterized protein (DUF924 family)